METLIYTYHFTVIAIIIATTIATLGAMTKKGVFANVNDTYTKILVASLLIELAGAFIGIYTTLPELKFKVAEKYMFQMEYSDVAKSWLESKVEEDRGLIDPFINNGGISSFFKFKKIAHDYEQFRDVSRITDQDSLPNFEKVLTKRERQYLDLYINNFNESPTATERAEELLFEYVRLKKSSGKVGRGTMWTSTVKDKLEGIIVYEFPEQITPSVLEFHGKKTSDSMVLYFDQKPSVFLAGGIIRRREAHSFNLTLKLNTKNQYEAKLGAFGDMRVQLWEI